MVLIDRHIIDKICDFVHTFYPRYPHIKASCFFRPLTGIMVLIFENLANNNGYGAPFPSPYGDYGSYLSTVST